MMNNNWSGLVMDQFQDAIYQREKWLVIGLMASLVWERARNGRQTIVQKSVNLI